MAEPTEHRTEHSDDIVAAPGAEREALTALDAFMTAFNGHDRAGMDAAFHFPHARIASGAVHILEGPVAPAVDYFARFIKETGWAYSFWDYRRAVQSKEDKVHFAVQFTRYRADHTTIGVYPSMWIVAKIDGRWGVQARSSFAP